MLALAAVLCFWVAPVGYSVWHAVIRPWRTVPGLAGASTEDVLHALGQPDLLFRSSDDLRSSLLVAGSYRFIPVPGPRRELPLSVGWMAYSARARMLSPSDLPAVKELAMWYDVPLTAGILVYLEDGRVTKLYFGGT